MVASRRASRRAFVWMTILGLLIGLTFIWLRHGAAPAVKPSDGALLPIGDAGTTRHAAPAATPASGHRAASTGSSDSKTARKCAQTVNDAVEFAKMEQSAANPVQAPEPKDKWLHTELDNLGRNTIGSGNPELLLTTLLLDPPETRSSSDPSVRPTLPDFGARAASSGSPLLAWHALRICADAKQPCPFADPEQSLLQADRQNADAWALVATLRYQRGDVAGALSAMQGAASAPTSIWYWTETIALVERALATGTAIPYPDRVEEAFGAAAAALPPESSPLKMCRVESATSRAWGEACLAFGTLEGEHNETEMAQGIAYAIREQALRALGDTESAAKVAAEHALFTAGRTAGGLELTTSKAELRYALIATDPARLHACLSDVQQSGENTGARAFLRQELPPLLERAGLLDRDGTQECFAQFFEPPAAVGTHAATAGR